MIHVSPADAVSTQKNPLEFSLDQPEIQKLHALNEFITDLAGVASLVGWDQQTQMPKGAIAVRSAQSAAIDLVIHEKIIEPEFGAAIQAAENVINADPFRFSAADIALVRVLRRHYDEENKLPNSFVRDFSEATSEGMAAWVEARSQKNFAMFAPYLARIVDLNRKRAHFLHPEMKPYASLFSVYEPGVPFTDAMAALEKVRAATVPLLKRIQSAQQIDNSSVVGNFSADKEMELCKAMLQVMGYQFNNGRIDLAAHPFMTSIGSPYDARVTTRLDPKFMARSLLAAMHEGGHALYEQGVSPTLVRTSLAHGTSLGVHESQSRYWENVVGRSEAFWNAHFEKARGIFSSEFANVTPREFAIAINRVEPSLIRVEADELTYNLHIIIRSEIETDLVEGNIEVKDAPAVWNQKYHDYLGIDPEDDSVGVMQDIHWSMGSIGYFPTYSLGNMFAAQFGAALKKAHPDLEQRLAAGETSFIREWQRENIHRWGRIFDANELSARVTGEPLNPDYLINYLTDKFINLYHLD